MSELTQEHQATNYQTFRHIERVRNLLNAAIHDLLQRAEDHDQSKLGSPEVEVFTECTSRLAGLTYGSDEYKACLADMKPALDHHYRHNRHHPEHWGKGINDMNLLDLIEMFMDWKAASERHDNGCIRKSIDHNAGRFEMSPQLVAIFHRTADWLATINPWHCFGCGCGGCMGNFCAMCGAGREDYVKAEAQ